MRLFRSARWILMTLLLCLVPASSHAGVFISVGFAPPVLPVYVQPVCPEPGLMWTPGYWGYGPDGYFWVPGAWVPAPYTGALWTPGYWGWGSGLYAWHPGYWGPHVGYYGGVNYGFGYMGVGFAGGVWRGGVFAYNSAVMHVGVGGGWGGNRVYVDRTIVERTTIVNNTHVSYNGGPGGINHGATAEERVAMNEHHLAPTSYQAQHANAAMADHNSYAKFNGGHPQNLAVSRPLAAENHPAPTGFNNNHATPQMSHGGNSFNNQQHTMNQNTYHAGQTNQYHPQTQSQPRNESRPAPQSRPQHETKEPKGKGR
jgi:hypothetical protein